MHDAAPMCGLSIRTPLERTANIPGCRGGLELRVLILVFRCRSSLLGLLKLRIPGLRVEGCRETCFLQLRAATVQGYCFLGVRVECFQVEDWEAFGP